MDYRFYFDLWEKYHTDRSGRKFPKVFVGQRPYLHFDGKVELNRDIQTGDHPIVDVLKDASKLSRHKFLPFIRDDRRIRRYRRKKDECLKHHQRFPIIKNRPIMYAGHKDACIYSFFSFIMQERYEKLLVKTSLQDNVIAYRSIPKQSDATRNKSNTDFANEIFQLIKEREQYGLVMVDVSHFFDTLDHRYLLEKWKMLMDLEQLPSEQQIVFNSLTKFRYVVKAEMRASLAGKKKPKAMLCTPAQFNRVIKKDGLIRQNRKPYGIPQGSPISGMLANLYMYDFDLKMKSVIEDEMGGVYRRYSDDILLIVPSAAMQKAYDLVKSEISATHLVIKDEKTECFTCDSSGNVFHNAVDSLGITNSPIQNKVCRNISATPSALPNSILELQQWREDFVERIA